MLSVGVILCDCVTCTCLSHCSTVALYNCHGVETHLQLKPIIIIRIIKSRRIRWAGHVARMGEKRNTYRILVGKPEGKSH
jgi:hypothetical protein